MTRPLAIPVLMAAAVVLAAGACSSSSSTSSPAPSATSSLATTGAPSVAATSAAATPARSTAASGSAASPAAASTTAAQSAPWPGYHADQSRTGAVAAVPALAKATKAWATDLAGAVRGQPLVVDGKILAATEKNRIVAMDGSGKVLWSRSVGAPLTNVGQVAGCGNIDPLGITSTMVVDAATGVVYAVAEISDGNGAVHHQLFGLSVSSGAVVLSANADPPLPAGENAVHLLQRASLALGNGRVYIGFGGNDGDCGSYHGWLVAMNEAAPVDKLSFEVAADGEGGAIWQSGGAPALDAAGDVYVTTGNANPDPPQGGPDPKKYTESVVKLSPELQPLASFKDTVAGGDEDLSTGNPVLLPGGEVFSVGKTDIGYLLSQSTLQQIAAIKGICDSDPDGGPAYDPATKQLFVPCRDGGIQVVDVAKRALGQRLDGADSAPIVVGADVWALDHSDAQLTEFAAAGGKKEQSVQIGSEVPIFTSPSVGLGLLLVATTSGVTAALSSPLPPGSLPRLRGRCHLLASSC